MSEVASEIDPDVSSLTVGEVVVFGIEGDVVVLCLLRSGRHRFPRRGPRSRVGPLHAFQYHRGQLM